MKKYKLSELFDLHMGKTPARNNPKYWEDGINLWIAIADMSSNGKYITTTKECITDRAISETGIKPILPGTVIMSFKLSVGKVARTTVKSYSNEAIMAFEIKDRDSSQYSIDNDYAYYLLSSLNFENVGNKAVKGKTLNKAILEDTEVYVHPWVEQREIISKLDKVHELIELRKQQLSKLDELVKSRFIELFGDPKHNPNGYPIKDFDEISVLITDGEHATPRRTDNGICLLSARNVLNHMLQLDDVDYIDEDEYNRIARRVVPQAGDILISCSGSIGRCCIVPDGLQFQMVRSAALIRFDNTINPVFAEWLITSDELQRQIAQSATQSSQANLFQGKIRKLHGYVPPLDLQEQFAAFVEQTDKSKFEIQNSLEKLETLKKALMQKYFG